MGRATSLDEIINHLRNLKPLLESRYHVEQLAVFGSYRRKENRPDSDLDILVSFYETPSLLEFVELEHMLSDHLGVEVDLVMEAALKPRIGQRIRREIIRV